MEHEALLKLYFVGAIVFNVTSWLSIWNGGAALAKSDPVLGSALCGLFFILLRCSAQHPKIHAVCCVLGLAVCAVGGVAAHIQFRSIYAEASAYHSSAWMVALALNLSACVLLLLRAQAPSRRRTSLIFGCVLIGGLVYYLSTPAEPLCPDAPFFDAPAAPLPSLPYQRSSQYLPMSDGVKLAVDVYLPAGVAPGTPLPTFLHLTRYHRAEQRSWLTKYLHFFSHPPNRQAYFPMRSIHYLNQFVADGYAFVSVDVRGTGASFGWRPVDLMQREELDYGEVSEWVIQQPWCNGRVGTGGISYDGIAGALAAAQGNIQAATLLFAPGDIWEDIAFAGGVPTTGFIDLYGQFTAASERNINVDDTDNDLPAAFKLVSSFALSGVSPVDNNKPDELQAAVREHAQNFDMLDAARDPSIVGKDSVVKRHEGRDYLIEELGNGNNTLNGLLRHNVSVYSVVTSDFVDAYLGLPLTLCR